MGNLIPIERVENKIYLIRGQKVMIDRDLAELYGVETRILKQAVKRNIERFPDDFMFELNEEEYLDWRSQFVMSNSDKMGLRWKPSAFTEQGIAMLSGILKSKRAVQVNIAIMRAFVNLRRILSSHRELGIKLAELERKYERHDVEIKGVFDAIRKLMVEEAKPKRKIGFIK
ncbi:DNA-binding protein [candidate division WOR-1 bacterium RIFOXYB2_FULL_42_35]|uniref:DNA-binding protein n=1 Tax=candidate division WOR-1 bacterium RIFOXYC2_FULL_41_25 TaxID=1802586 RepID=A0A1F4TJK7_UNCSA|nr:MAG: DNA-binding protein [candidate division WOR-1 bacterium RIFOXYA2_FULL_41_14]OGC21885.1 MAG: DNA-binding protein [candidate division WOR-1 bacterium RIFOXYB2_FULL_42_35]OGC32749.1 MAG: DNA-binding protein [candidate division WOR-1 bacterium RIFOXYC2_FULL_41_25]OGC42545.1 MAG: DNA-binding protein [candidate division WOR-1 bacterium RIFOXYD2_FULL_41_8]